MNCRLGDMVMFKRGCCVGAFGTVDSTSNVEFCDWLVRTDNQVPCFTFDGMPTLGRIIHCADSDLMPIRPGKAPYEVDQGVDIGAVV